MPDDSLASIRDAVRSPAASESCDAGECFGRKGIVVTDIFEQSDGFVVYEWAPAKLGQNGKHRPGRGRGVDFALLSPAARQRACEIANSLSSLITAEAATRHSSKSLRRQVALHIMAIFHDPGGATTVRRGVAAMVSRLRQLAIFEARLFYMMGALLPTLSALFWVVYQWWTSWDQNLFAPVQLLAKVIVFGVLGAFMMICFRLRRLPVEWLAPRYVHFLNGFSRIVFGALASLAVYMALRSGIGLAALTGQPMGEHPHFHNIATIFLVSILAGFSEGFVPHLFDSVEQNYSSEGAPTRISSEGGDPKGRSTKAGEPKPTAGSSASG